MAELTKEQRKKKLHRQTKRLKRTLTREEKAKARRESLGKQQKKLDKQIKSTTGEKKKANLKAEKKDVRQAKKSQRTKAHHAAKQASNIEKRRQQTSKYSTTKAATPGVKNDIIDPFLTNDQIAEKAQKTQDYKDTISNLQYALKMQQTETDYGKAQIDKQKPYDLEKADSSAASRGLFNSSIRDAQLYDIDATAAINRANLDREFDAMRMDSERQAVQATSAFNTYNEALNQAAVDNASEASEGMELYKVDPTKAVTTQHQLKVRPVKVKPPKPKPNRPTPGKNPGGLSAHPQGNIDGRGPGPAGGPTPGRPNPNRQNPNG
jgi:hypothetical protein